MRFHSIALAPLLLLGVLVEQRPVAAASWASGVSPFSKAHNSLSGAMSTKERTAEAQKNLEDRQQFINKVLERDLLKTRDREHNNFVKRRERHLYGSSRHKNGHYWRHHMSAATNNKNVEESVIINPSGERNLQSGSGNAALEVCNTAVPLEESVGSEFGTVCTCTPNTTQRTAMLECKDLNCAYCNEDNTVCTGYSYGVLFDKDGLDVEYFEQDAYTFGRNEAIRYTERDGECTVSVGGTDCNQCFVEDCDDGYVGISVSCGNVEKGAVYNSCQDGFTTTGIFQAYNEEEFGVCYNTFDICERSANAIEERYDCYCDVDPTNSDGSILRCQDKCEYCDEFINVCGQETYQQTFANAMFKGSKRTVSYTSGRSERVSYEEFNCDASGCLDCKMNVLVAGVQQQCNHCDIMVCQDGSRAPQINCGNIDETISDTIDFCTPPSLSGTVLEYFEQGFIDTCITKKELACREAKSKYEDHEHKFDCICADQEDGSMELQCQATCGDLCNDEASVCVRESFYQDFHDEGESSYFRKDIQYTVGRKETLSYVEYMDGICSMTIDGAKCNSCVIKTCPENPNVDRAPTVDCTGFESGAVLDLCEPDISVDTGIFEPFSVAEFQECLDRTPVNGVCDTAIHFSSLPQNTSGTTMLITFDGQSGCGSTESFSPGLWYRVKGTGVGIEASLCDKDPDFTAQLSVYKGSNCKSLECLAASETDCKVSWLGEEEVVYYIRVHGIGGQIGNFEMSIINFNWGSTVCKSSKELFEINPNLSASCRECEEPDKDGHVHLHCSIDCITCDETGSVCANRTQSSKFDSGGNLVTTKSHYQFTMGRSEYLTVQTSGCSGGNGCAECEVTVDEEVCTSCTILDCSDDDRTQGIQAVCGNSTINTCNSTDSSSALTNILHPLIDESYNMCFSRDSLTACMDHREYEQNLDEDVMCECEKVAESKDSRLICQRRQCLRCNNERTICGFDAFGSTFEGELGRLTSTFVGFQFAEGRNDLFSYHTVNDIADQSCMVSVNAETCDTCLSTQCPDDDTKGEGFLHGFKFDCQNVLDGIFYDGCSAISLPGVFEVINDPSYQSCVAMANPKDACEEALVNTMSLKSSMESLCGCHATESGGYELVCADANDCQFCSDRSETLCADYTDSTTEINQFGSLLSQSLSFQFKVGRDDLLVIRGNGIECQVSINGEICSSCNYVSSCSELNRGGDRSTLWMMYDMDCSNIMENATYHCGYGHEVFMPIFQESQYICESDTMSPSSSPTDGPTPMPSPSPTKSPGATSVARPTTSPVAAAEKELSSGASTFSVGSLLALVWTAAFAFVGALS